MRIIIVLIALLVPVQAFAMTPLQECITSMTEHPDAEADRICRDFVRRDEKVMAEVLAERTERRNATMERLDREEAAIRAQLYAIQSQAVTSIAPSLIQGINQGFQNMRVAPPTSTPLYQLPTTFSSPMRCTSNRIGSTVQTNCY